MLLPNVFHTNDMFALSEKSAEKKTKTGRLPIAHYKQKPAGSDLWPVNRCIPNIYIYIYIYIHTHTHTYIYIYTHTHKYTHTYIYIYIYVCVVENFVLLKCRNSEEKTRRLRIGSSAEFLYSMTCVVICSHRRSPLSHFYRVSYRYFWRRDS